MNRREALAAIASMPEIARVSIARVQPNDVIVFEAPGSLSEETCNRIKQYGEYLFPDCKCIVMGDGLTMKVLRKSDG